MYRAICSANPYHTFNARLKPQSPRTNLGIGLFKGDNIANGIILASNPDTRPTPIKKK